MKFDINKKCILLNVDEKKTVNLYTLVDNQNGDKVVSIGVKANGFKKYDLVEVTLSFRTQPERFDTKSSGLKYVETVSTFVSKISKVNVDETK